MKNENTITSIYEAIQAANEAKHSSVGPDIELTGNPEFDPEQFGDAAKLDTVKLGMGRELTSQIKRLKGEYEKYDHLRRRHDDFLADKARNWSGLDASTKVGVMGAELASAMAKIIVKLIAGLFGKADRFGPHLSGSEKAAIVKDCEDRMKDLNKSIDKFEKQIVKEAERMSGQDREELKKDFFERVYTATAANTLHEEAVKNAFENMVDEGASAVIMDDIAAQFGVDVEFDFVKGATTRHVSEKFKEMTEEAAFSWADETIDKLDEEKEMIQLHEKRVEGKMKFEELMRLRELAMKFGNKPSNSRDAEPSFSM